MYIRRQRDDSLVVYSEEVVGRWSVIGDTGVAVHGACVTMTSYKECGGEEPHGIAEVAMCKNPRWTSPAKCT